MARAMASEMAAAGQGCVAPAAMLRNISSPSGTVGGLRVSRLQWIIKYAGFQDVS